MTGQIILMTAVSVLIASLGAYLSIHIARYIIESLVTSMFYGGENIVLCAISPLIPLAAAVILIGFVLLFTKTSLNKISRMDVISVINEVN